MASVARRILVLKGGEKEKKPCCAYLSVIRCAKLVSEVHVTLTVIVLEEVTSLTELSGDY